MDIAEDLYYNNNMYSLTIFKNRFDNKTHRTMSFRDWSEFEKLLYDLSSQPGSKKVSPLISPSLYQPDTTRANANVVLWNHWCCMDVDDFECTAADIKSKVQAIVGNYYFVCYSTASSTEDAPRFRLVFPLTEVVENARIKHFWFALNNEIAGLADKQTKDLSRMFYVPAQYPDAYNFIWTSEGEFMNPDALMAKWPYAEVEGKTFLDRLPEVLKKQVVEYRKNSLDNTEYTWTSYSDCPFFPKKLAAEYQTINNTGWYRKMYQIMIATAGNAIKAGYPITAREVSEMCYQFDRDTGNWYENRPMEREADSAIEWVYRNS